MTDETIPEETSGLEPNSTFFGGLGKKTLLEKVVALVTETLPEFEASTLLIPPVYKRKAHIDLLLGLRSKDHSVRLAIKVKPLGYPSRISQAIAFFKQIPLANAEYPVIVTDQISKEGALLARQAGIGYLDLAGNCYLDFDGLCLKKTAPETIKRAAHSLQNLFSPKATRVARTLIESGPHSWSAVDLARLSNVSIGYVYKVVRKLSENGFAQEDGARIQFNEPGKLLRAWAEEYRIPSSQITSYVCSTDTVKQWVLNFAHHAKQEDFEFALTLDTAVSLLYGSSGFAAPIYLYIDRQVQEPFGDRLGLKPVSSDGVIHILQPYDEGVFHHKQMIEGWPVVSRTQLYLDLSQKSPSDRKVTEFLNTELAHFKGTVEEPAQEPSEKKAEDRSWRLILSKAQNKPQQIILEALMKKLKLSRDDAQSLFNSRPIILFDQKTKQEAEELKSIFNQEVIATSVSNNPKDAETLPRVKWPKNVTCEDFKEHCSV